MHTSCCSLSRAAAGAWRRPPPAAVPRTCIASGGPLLAVQRRALAYSTFGAMRRPRRTSDTEATANTTTAPSAAAAAADATTPPPVRPGAGASTSTRPLQSSVQQRKEAAMPFPKTLKSGRPAQQSTMSQQLFYAKSANAAELAQQQQRDREYVQQMRELHAKRGGADRRFFQGIADYRDIQDGDPYASVFGETGATQRIRTAAWQRQFEKENEDVELPYERTNVMARLAPNWFVRYFVDLRDKGGADQLYMLWTCAFVAVSLLLLVGYLFYTAPQNARPTHEIR